MISSSVEAIETVLFDYMSPNYDLDLDGSKPVFSMTLWPMMMHHHTKFGNKTSVV